MVLRARDFHDESALEELCRACWYPVYSFVRRRDATPEEAEDLTQGFFAHLLERRVIDTADPARGRFRSFLLGALKLYLSTAERHRRAAKRGGGIELIPLDLDGGERLFANEPATYETPDLLYDPQWAKALLRRAQDALRGDYERAGKAAFFSALNPFLSGSDARGAREALAAQLGMEIGTVTVAIYRMRRRYAELLRNAIAETVDDPDDLDAEIRYLLEVVR